MTASVFGNPQRIAYSPERTRTSPKFHRDIQLDTTNIYCRAVTPAAMLHQLHFSSTRSASLQGQEAPTATGGRI